MEKENNTVAKIMKVYAILNLVVCLILAFVIGGDSETLGIIFFSIALCINFAIYAAGEVIQILHDIRRSTAASASATVKQSDDELPEL